MNAPNPACNQCVASACCAQVAACLASADCLALEACTRQCDVYGDTPYGDQCYDYCELQRPQAVPLLDAAYDCLYETCEAYCDD